MSTGNTLQERINVRDLTEVVDPILARHRCTVAELESASRRPHLVGARRDLAVYLARECGWSHRAIGEFLARDPTTVANYLRPKKRTAAAS